MAKEDLTPKAVLDLPGSGLLVEAPEEGSQFPKQRAQQWTEPATSGGGHFSSTLGSESQGSHHFLGYE